MAWRGGRKEGAWQLCELIFIWVFLVLKSQDCWYFYPHTPSTHLPVGAYASLQTGHLRPGARVRGSSTTHRDGWVIGTRGREEESPMVGSWRSR